VVFSEDFSGFSTCTHANPSPSDLSASLDSKTSAPGWTGYKVYSAGGEIKLGTADVPGWIETPEISFTGVEGIIILKFDISKRPDETANVRILLNGIQIGDAIEPADEYQTKEIPVTEGTGSGKIRFESLAKRFYLDNVKVVAVMPTVGFEVLSDQASPDIYPNPASGVVVIENILPFDRVEVHTVSGRLIESIELHDKTSFEYSVSELKNGLYLFRFIGQDRVFTVKVVKY